MLMMYVFPWLSAVSEAWCIPAQPWHFGPTYPMGCVSAKSSMAAIKSRGSLFFFKKELVAEAVEAGEVA